MSVDKRDNTLDMRGVFIINCELQQQKWQFVPCMVARLTVRSMMIGVLCIGKVDKKLGHEYWWKMALTRWLYMDLDIGAYKYTPTHY